jgi:hypothetical protein
MRLNTAIIILLIISFALLLMSLILAYSSAGQPAMLSEVLQNGFRQFWPEYLAWHLSYFLFAFTGLISGVAMALRTLLGDQRLFSRQNIILWVALFLGIVSCPFLVVLDHL